MIFSLFRLYRTVTGCRHFLTTHTSSSTYAPRVWYTCTWYLPYILLEQQDRMQVRVSTPRVEDHPHCRNCWSCTKKKMSLCVPSIPFTNVVFSTLPPPFHHLSHHLKRTLEMVQETLVEESTILTIWALKVGPFFFLFIDCVYLVWPGEKKKKKERNAFDAS